MPKPNAIREFNKKLRQKENKGYAKVPVQVKVKEVAKVKKNSSKLDP
jgi:hypothetical protein